MKSICRDIPTVKDRFDAETEMEDKEHQRVASFCGNYRVMIRYVADFVLEDLLTKSFKQLGSSSLTSWPQQHESLT